LLSKVSQFGDIGCDSIRIFLLVRHLKMPEVQVHDHNSEL
jgi:hypothetical protein